MSNLTVRLSALKTFYKESEDTIDLYGKVILAAIKDCPLSIKEAHKKVLEEFKLDIPQDMLVTIAKRLMQNNFINWSSKAARRNEKITATEKGQQRQAEAEQKFKEILRQENALLDELKKSYFPEEEIEDIRKYLKDFIVNNAYISVNLMLGDENKNAVSIDTEIKNKIRDFFLEVENKKPEYFNFLKDILFGQIVASCLLEKKDTISLKDVVFYVDTNVFFSLLELDDEADNKSAEDAVKLIKECGGRFKIFEHLKEEALGLLRVSLNTIDRYSLAIPVDNITYRMKAKGYDKSRIMGLITYIDRELNKLSIRTAYAGNKEIIVNEEDYREFISQKITKDKNEQSIQNDCKSMELIRLERKSNNHYFLDKCKAVLLSNDRAVARFCRKKARDSQNVPGALTPEQVTGILWLNKVKAAPNTFIHNFLSRNIASQAVESRIWTLFITLLEQEKRNKNLTEEQINQMMVSETTKMVLMEGNLEKVKQLFDDAKISSMKKEKDADQENINQKDAIIAHLKNELQKRDEEEVAKQELREQALTERAKKQADKQLLFFERIAYGVASVLALSIFVGAVFVHAFIGAFGFISVAFIAYSSPLPNYLKKKRNEWRDKLIEANKAKIKAERGLDE